MNLESTGRSFHSFDLYPTDLNSSSHLYPSERKTAFRLLILISIILNYDSGVIPASLLQIQSELHLSFTQKAALGSIVYLGVSFASFFVSPIFQKFPASRTLVTMLSLNCGFCLLCSFSYNLPVMFAGRFFMGVTQAFCVIYAPVWINEFSPKQKEATWMGLLQASVPVGVVFGYTTASVINFIGVVSWRFAMQLQSLFLLPLIVYFAHLSNEDIDILDHAQETIELSSCKTQMKSLFTNPIYLFVTPALCCLYFVIAGMQYWVTLYLIKVLMIENYVAIPAFIAVSITAPIAGVYIGGVVGDFIGGYKGSNVLMAIKFCFILGALAAVCTAPAAIARTAFGIFVSLWLLLFFGAALVPCATGVCVDAIDREYQASASAVLQLSANLFAFFLAPVLTGYYMEGFTEESEALKWGFRFILMVSWIGLGFLALAFLVAKRKHEQIRLSM